MSRLSEMLTLMGFPERPTVWSAILEDIETPLRHQDHDEAKALSKDAVDATRAALKAEPHEYRSLHKQAAVKHSKAATAFKNKATSLPKDSDQRKQATAMMTHHHKLLVLHSHRAEHTKFRVAE